MNEVIRIAGSINIHLGKLMKAAIQDKRGTVRREAKAIKRNIEALILVIGSEESTTPAAKLHTNEAAGPGDGER